jgi:glycosyltransferase involved in cell wall biosynthesis
MLESFKHLNEIDIIEFELIIIANACIDNTIYRAQELLLGEKFNFKIYEERVPGLSVARNRGIKESKGDIIAFLDDDIQLDRDWLVGLDKSFTESDYDIIGGKIELWWKDCSEPSWFTLYERRLLGFNDHGSELCAAQPSMIFGGNFAFKKTILEFVGGFDSKFGRVGNSKGAGEENDFVSRALRGGFSVGYSSLFTIDHLVSPDRIKFKSLRNFSVGAGGAHSALSEVSALLWLKGLIKFPVELLKKLFEGNYRHAILFAYSRLASLGIIR